MSVTLGPKRRAAAMTRPSTAIASTDYAEAVAWFVELARALQRRDRVREAQSRRRLRDLGVSVRFGEPARAETAESAADGR